MFVGFILGFTLAGVFGIIASIISYNAGWDKAKDESIKFIKKYLVGGRNAHSKDNK